MASEKKKFKGFTFKKLGSSTTDSSPHIPPPVQSTGNKSKSTLSSHGLATLPPLAEPSKSLNSFAKLPIISENQDASKSTTQTNIMSFAKKKVAVAAVLPHRSSVPKLAAKSNTPKTFSNTFNAVDDDDDDDFELLDHVWSQEPTQMKSTMHVKSSFDNLNKERHSPTFSPRPRGNTNLTVVPDTPEKFEDSQIQNFEDEEEAYNDTISLNRKRRRTTPTFEIEQDKRSCSSNTRNSESQFSPFQRNIGVTKPSDDNVDICNQPLLNRDFKTLSEEECVAMKDVLLSITNELCDMFCKIRTCDLMDLLSSDYERLQKLLTLRKQINDAGIIKRTTNQQQFQVRKTALKCSTPISSSSGLINSSTLFKLSGTNSHSNSPYDTRDEIKTKPLSQITPKHESSVPCGESFFTTPTNTSSKMDENVSQFSKWMCSPSNFSMKKDSHDGTSDQSLICGQRTPKPATISNSFNTPEQVTVSTSFNTPKLATKSNSFNKLMPTPCNSQTLIKRNETSSEQSIVHHDIASSGSNFGLSSQEQQWNDAVHNYDDFSDEMEVAMAFDDEFVNDSKICNTASATKSSLVASESRDIVHSVSSGSQSQDASQIDLEAFVVSDDDDDIALQAISDKDYTPKFSSTDHDDGNSSEFEGMKFAHSAVLYSMFRQMFGLSEFRPNQLSAINAALLGNDCFILMPTGGGKSLCYQLPALVGQGVSVIVSPLKALIQDQTQRLLSLDIPTANLSSDQDLNQQQLVYSGLYQRCPAYKMVYVTPEKLSASEKLLNCLESLYKRQLLIRFVIDEAHCVSQWGHDFRPDYKRLHVLRQRFSGVPVMALTATATPRVRQDIIHQLGMKDTKWFMQSFNRPNLKYSVMPKKPKIASTDVINFIKQKFPNESGIIYCLSRKECGDVATALRQAGLAADQYHAGLDDVTRSSVQEKWLNDDRCKIICATIAFGMGIDKADVRFVIHFSLPKSMEGYYQEAGRAGRDQRLAHCVLLYSYQDVKRWRRIIEMDKSSATFESRRVHNDNLYRMVNFCENVTDCRRSQVLNYLGEYSFSRSMCSNIKGATCDNCLTKDCFNIRNVTEDAKEIVKCVRQLNSGGRSGYTLIHILEIFKGSQNTKIKKLGHERLALHGRGKQWARPDVERLCRKLVIDGILKEDLQITAQEHTACYIKLGPKALELMQSKIKVELPMQGNRQLADVNKGKVETTNEREKMEMKCLEELRVMAKTIAAEHNVRHYTVIFPESALKQLAQRTPITINEMIDQIDHFNATIIDKYKAERLLEITLKYSMEFGDLEPDDINENPDDSNQFASDTDEGMASRYWEEPSSSSYRGNAGRGGGRGGKRKFPFKKRAKGKKTSGPRKKATTSKAKGKKTVSSGAKTSTFNPQSFSYQKSNTSNSSSTFKKTSGVTKSTLGLMPDPKSRPFLTAKKSFM